jgi:excisionase family DNA binding protein
MAFTVRANAVFVPPVLAAEVLCVVLAGVPSIAPSRRLVEWVLELQAVVGAVPDREWMSPKQAALLTGLSVRRLTDWAARGVLPAKKMGGRWLLDADAVEELVA